MVGLDTGFFIAMMRGDRKAVDLWRELSSGDSVPVVSVLTLGELLYISYRSGKPDEGKLMVESIDLSTRVIPVDRPITEKAASMKAGRSIPYVDSIILATFLLHGCKVVHTTDRNHFSEIKNKALSFIFY